MRPTTLTADQQEIRAGGPLAACGERAFGDE